MSVIEVGKQTKLALLKSPVHRIVLSFLLASNHKCKPMVVMLLRHDFLTFMSL